MYFWFQLTYKFDESEVKQDEEGDEGDLAPTDAALSALENDLTNTVQQHYPIDPVHALFLTARKKRI